jgi:hypothetical protein
MHHTSKDYEANNAPTIKSPKDLPPTNRNEKSLRMSGQRVLARTQEPGVRKNLDQYQFNRVVNNLKEELETLKSDVNKKIEEELYSSSRGYIRFPGARVKEPVLARTQRELYLDNGRAMSVKMQSPCSIGSGYYIRDEVSEVTVENEMLRRQLDQLRSNERLLRKVNSPSNA